MSLRFYIITQEGAGTAQDPIAPFIRGIILSPDWYVEIDNPAKRYTICLVSTSDAIHATIDADARTKTLSPLFVDMADLRAKMALTFADLPAAMQTAITARLEALGLDSKWIVSTTTIKEIYRRVLKHFSVVNIAQGELNSSVMTFLGSNLDATVGSLPAGVRNAANTWLTAKRVNLTGVTGTTTIREVIRLIYAQFPVGTITLAGESF